MHADDLVFLCGGQGQVMEQVLRYQPASDDEVIDIQVPS